MLGSFEIRHFRTFSHLRIQRLGRVNLIVGRNNVGKTMLLEALRIYAVGGYQETLHDLLMDRHEVAPTSESAKGAWLRVESLFHRGASQNGLPREVQLGPVDDAQNSVHIFLQLPGEDLPTAGLCKLPVAWTQTTDGPWLVSESKRHSSATPVSSLSVPMPSPRHLASPQGLIYPYAFVPARGLSSQEIARWWDSIVLQAPEEQVVQCLRLIAPIERISLVDHALRSGERLVMVRLAGDSVPVPLRSSGDGLERMFQIALALQWARLGRTLSLGAESLWAKMTGPSNQDEALLLLDEIENGIHYTVLPKLWRFLLQIAKQQNIQVFATTHSWDCIKGFQIAAAQEHDVSCMLIRLERRDQTNKAVLFHQDELPYVTQDPLIEIR